MPPTEVKRAKVAHGKSAHAKVTRAEVTPAEVTQAKNSHAKVTHGKSAHAKVTPAEVTHAKTSHAKVTPPQFAHAQTGRLHVVVALLRRDGRMLMQQRRRGTPCAGQWEFPGGKVEPGETAAHALARELQEELGANTAGARPLLSLPFDYAHARVWLEVFLLDNFRGTASAREGQNILWVTRAQIAEMDVLGAVHPILEALDG